jgi:4-hydroxy-3-methylbut-2-enyl diphosphate reductase
VAPVVVVRDLAEAAVLASFIRGERDPAGFSAAFPDRTSPGFEPARDLVRIGVVNQTTMLATETEAIAALLRSAMRDRYGEAFLAHHFADTSDTLCYATNENQGATKALVEEDARCALVVGGFNSSNTSHLVELCEERLPSYFIGSRDDILSPNRIRHFDYRSKAMRETADWLPADRPVDLLLTAGASCPDILLDQVIERVLSFEEDVRPVEDVIEALAVAHP